MQQQFKHKLTDWCRARDEFGRLCGRLIVQRVWTYFRVWNKARDGVRRPTRCCECIAKEIASGRRAA